MAVKSLNEIDETRNIESSIDENTLASGETSAGFFGTFKLFSAVKKAIDYISTIAGNKTFSGNVTVSGTLSVDSLAAKTKSVSLTFSSDGEADSGLSLNEKPYLFKCLNRSGWAWAFTYDAGVSTTNWTIIGLAANKKITGSASGTIYYL